MTTTEISPYVLTNERVVAYFSMEIALHPDIPTYSGGLGVLAGDTMRSCADLELNLVAVTLVSRLGYFRQEIVDGRQVEHPEPWEPQHWARPMDARVAVTLSGRKVWVGGWLYKLESPAGRSQPILLLDTDLDDNLPEDRRLTDYLYGGDQAYRLKQEAILGIGGVRMLAALGFNVSHYHMNEGHSSLLAPELLRRSARPESELRPGEPRYALADVRNRCSFTTHTPVEAGHDKFDYDLVEQVLDGYFDLPLLRQLGGVSQLNMTRLALNLSETVNGVTKRHARTSQALFPEYPVSAITNGVHPCTWTSAHFARLYDEHLPSWSHEPELLVRADCCISPERIWRAHTAAKEDLLTSVKASTSVALDPAAFTIGFARRMTAYKRPDLLFDNLSHLRRIAKDRPFQIVLAGKAHPADEPGKALIEQLHRVIDELDGDVRIIFLPNYNMNVAKKMVAGVDLWLNTPLPPLEASGTSGMKAAFNGVPSLSVLDGWWIEGCIEGVTGWGIDSSDGDRRRDALVLYEKLESIILPLFYDDHDGWVKVMQHTISKNASFFNSHRMMRRYVCEAYIR